MACWGNSHISRKENTRVSHHGHPPVPPREAAGLAVNRWVSMRANMSLGAYDIYQGAETLSEPQWPGKSMEDILNVAFRGHVISDAEHPVIKRLQGRA